jgi:hypothetical protein
MTVPPVRKQAQSAKMAPKSQKHSRLGQELQSINSSPQAQFREPTTTKGDGLSPPPSPLLAGVEAAMIASGLGVPLYFVAAVFSHNFGLAVAAALVAAGVGLFASLRISSTSV